MHLRIHKMGLSINRGQILNQEGILRLLHPRERELGPRHLELLQVEPHQVDQIRFLLADHQVDLIVLRGLHLQADL